MSAPNMASSDFFRHAVNFEHDPVAKEHYERTVGLVFEKEDEKARIEVRCWTNVDLETYRAKDTNLIGSVNGNTLLTCSSPADGIEHTAHSAPEYGEARSTTNVDASIASGSRSAQLVVLNLDLGQLRRFIQNTSHTPRVFYIRQRNSYSRLLITKEQFNIILHECQVFPQFKEFILDFRWKLKETEIGPPRIKFRPSFDPENPYGVGRGFETAYVVRYVELTNRSEKSPWSLRQFAVYHKSTGHHSTFCSTWILAGASQRTEEYFDRHAASATDSLNSNPFELHVLFLGVSISSWRPYIAYLGELVAELSRKALMFKVGDKDSLRSFYEVEVRDSQRLKDIEDRVSDAALCLESTLDTVTTLIVMYRQYLHIRLDDHTPRDRLCVGVAETDAILFALHEKQKEVSYAQKKVEAMFAKTCTTRAVISTLLESLNGRNLYQQMTVLEHLQRQGQEENATMRQLAEKGIQDSKSVKILTVIMLMYLPCTVVSSFYSTQFVHQEDTPTGPVMGYAHNAWLFFAVTIPLTLFTVAAWYTCAYYKSFFQALPFERSCQRDKLQDRAKRFISGKAVSELPT